MFSKNKIISTLVLILLVSFILVGCTNKSNNNKNVEFKSYDKEFKEEYSEIIDDIIELTNKKMDKKEIIENINKIWAKNSEARVSYEFAEKIILEKYRNQTINAGKLVDKENDEELEENDIFYIPAFNSGYIVDLVERHSKEEINKNEWLEIVKYLEENYDKLKEFDKMDEDGIEQMDLYITVYSKLK